MKVLVTGSSGLIGREVVKLLQAKNIQVILFSKKDGLDILKPEQLAKHIKGCDAVIHLAATLNEAIPASEIKELNVKGTQNVLEVAAKERVARLVFTSSVGVYGNSGGIKTEESEFAPETAYEQSKAEAEKLAVSYQELVPYTIIRPAIVTGPNAYWKQIFSVVKQNLPLIGEGTNTWQTVHYKDVASAIVFLLLLDAAENEAFIIAGNDKPTLKELVQTMRSQLGMKNPPPKVPLWIGLILAQIWGLWMALRGKPNILSPTNIKRMLHERNYDLTKIHAYGWKAKYNYQTALKETLQELQHEKTK